MSEAFHFHIHGVSVIPEFTKEFTGDENGLRLIRSGHGARVTQNSGTANWFHFALPTPSRLDGDEVFLRNAIVYANVNEFAHLDILRAHEVESGHAGATADESTSPGSPVFYGSDLSGSPLWWGLPLNARAGTVGFRAQNRTIKGAVVLSAHVRFEGSDAGSDLGEITFYQAVGSFREK